MLFSQKLHYVGTMASKGLAGITGALIAGSILFIAAIVLLLWAFAGLSLLLVLALFVTMIGVVMMAISAAGLDTPRRPTGPSHRMYRAFWGVIVTVLGILGVLSNAFGVSAPVLVAILLVVIGALIIVVAVALRPRGRSI